MPQEDKKLFLQLPPDLNAEQKQMFAKLDILKQDIENGSVFDYEDSILSGDRIAFVQTFYDDEKKRPHKYFGYNYGTGACTFCEYSAEGPEKQMMSYYDGSLQIEDFKEGLIYEEIGYKNNQLEGHVLQRYPNGQMKEDAYYKNGLRDQYGYHGLECRDYNEQGVLIKKAQYTAGQLDGTYVEYYENGQIKVNASYILGQKDGLCETYDVNGRVSEEFYMKGQKMEKVSTDKELASISDSFSFDKLLSSFEKDNSSSDAVDKQPKRSLSEILSGLSDEVQGRVALGTEDYKDTHIGKLFKGSNMVPPPPPVVSHSGQAPKTSQTPKGAASDKAPVLPKVFLPGKGGR